MADHLRTRLLALRDETTQRLARLDAELHAVLVDRSDGSADDEHDPEGVPLSAEWSMLAGVRHEASRTLDEVDDALARHDAGRYGVCLDCGEQIPPGRLEARPTAVLCVACAERAQR